MLRCKSKVSWRENEVERVEILDDAEVWVCTQDVMREEVEVVCAWCESVVK